MKTAILIVFFALLVSGCSSVNEFGMRRNHFSLEKMKPTVTAEVFGIIDTTQLYRLEYTDHRLDKSLKTKSGSSNESNPAYLKFYGNGRVGEFRNVDLENPETLNPKRAKAHLYSFEKGRLVMQVYFKSAQCGECFAKQEVTKTGEDKIVAVSGDFTYAYRKVGIPAAYLKYKPDW